MKILIVGFTEPGHMGSHFASAARKLGLDHYVLDAAAAHAKTRLGRSIDWRLRGKRPFRMERFSELALETCAALRCDLILTTGCAPLDRPHIERLRNLGAKLINYSTDDPWNPALRAPWFLSAAPSYDAVFTPRHANVADFRGCGVRDVHYLPFAYDPEVHRPWPEDRATGAPSDVLFVGGCDADRLPLISALIDAGLDLALFGGYWDRHFKTRNYWRGLANQDTIRSASAAARICLCLVRRSNRDGHVMRSFEAAAIGGCIMAEDTADHRELFGPDDHAVRYFRTTAEAVQQSKFLLADAAARRRLSIRLRERLAAGKHTYADRLATMMQLSGMCGPPSRTREVVT
jgi:spore maturation protein CgeB